MPVIIGDFGPSINSAAGSVLQCGDQIATALGSTAVAVTAAQNTNGVRIYQIAPTQANGSPKVLLDGVAAIEHGMGLLTVTCNPPLHIPAGREISISYATICFRVL